MNPTILKRLRCLGAIGITMLVAVLTVPHVSAAPACGFDEPIVDPQGAPTPLPGTRWTYSIGASRPELTLRLQTVEPQQLALSIDGEAVRHEWRETYADVNPLRKGEKILLRFPLSVGAQWQDRFEEPGEIRASFGSYRYDYVEESSSRVVAVETVRTALGDVNAYRIERDARWHKSNPRSDDMKHMRLDRSGAVDGMERSISWYAPSVGRVVLRRSIKANPNYRRYPTAETDSPRLMVTELVGFQRPDGCRVEAAPTQARVPDDLPPLNYPLMLNNRWEFLLIRHQHVPAVSVDR